MRTPVLFVVIALVHLAGEALEHPLVNYTKPLLMPALALWWWTNSKGDPMRQLILAALLFSCLGDVLLMACMRIIFCWVWGRFWSRTCFTSTCFGD
jgi:uncharacterized membrane protein YhhN